MYWQKNYGHCFCDALYSPCANKTTICKNEYRAKKWAMYTLLNPNKIKQLIDLGFQHNNYEFAEELRCNRENVNLCYKLL